MCALPSCYIPAVCPCGEEFDRLPGERLECDGRKSKRETEAEEADEEAARMFDRPERDECAMTTAKEWALDR